MFKLNPRNILNFTYQKISTINQLLSFQFRTFTIAQPVFSHEFKSRRTGNTNPYLIHNKLYQVNRIEVKEESGKASNTDQVVSNHFL